MPPAGGIQKSGTFAGESELQLELTAIVVNGQTLPLVTGEYELKGKSRVGSQISPREGDGNGLVKRWRPCDHCAAHMVLRYDARQGLLMVSPFEDSEKVLTPEIVQSSAAAEVARVLIRANRLGPQHSGWLKASHLNSGRRRVV